MHMIGVVMQIACGVASSGMLNWRRWLTRIFRVYILSMVAISRLLDAKPCWEEFCYFGVLDIQSMVTDKVNHNVDKLIMRYCLKHNWPFLVCGVSYNIYVQFLTSESRWKSFKLRNQSVGHDLEFVMLT